MRRGDYHGLPTVVVESPFLRLEALAHAGPRLVRLSLAGSEENLLAETPSAGWETPRGVYHLYGGHRLWLAPDAPGRNDLPDDSGLTVEPLPDGLRLSRPPEAGGTIAKSMEVHLDRTRPALTLRHTLRNEGPLPVEVSAWAITQLPLGGVALVPLPTSPADSASITPNRSLALWPYTRWDDARVHIHDDCILVEAALSPQRLKIGCLNTHGWIAYQRGRTILVKRFTADRAARYPDFGCNVEVYLDERHLELETLGPLHSIAPQASLEHIERWEIGSRLEELVGDTPCLRAVRQRSALTLA